MMKSIRKQHPHQHSHQHGHRFRIQKALLILSCIVISCLVFVNYTFLQKQQWQSDILDSVVANHHPESFSSLSSPSLSPPLSLSSSSISSSAIGIITDTNTSNISSKKSHIISWCDKIKNERSKLHPDLHISYPCSSNNGKNYDNNNMHYKSAIVTYLTAGVEEGKGSRIVFTGQQYINGALALGASLNRHLTRGDTIKLLLVKNGFTLPESEKLKLESVGWTIGTAPDVTIDAKYVPRFKRYKTTYTKVSAIGLSEFECVLLMDADTLVVGSIDELLSCNVFNDDYDGGVDAITNTDSTKENTTIKKRSEYRVGGTLDYYHKRWKHFNTGSILWNTDSEEMNRVYALTKNESFMTRFESDQIFLNAVYPDRNDNKINNILVEEGIDNDGIDKRQHSEHWGSVVNLGWNYNAQTHVEVQLPQYWNKHKSDLKIIHYTEKKGWQCPEQYGEAPSEEIMSSLKNCEKKDRDELCFCGTGYLWWDALKEANKIAATAAISR